jgi:hypothetical protein
LTDPSAISDQQFILMWLATIAFSYERIARDVKTKETPNKLSS